MMTRRVIRRKRMSAESRLYDEELGNETLEAHREHVAD